MFDSATIAKRVDNIMTFNDKRQTPIPDAETDPTNLNWPKTCKPGATLDIGFLVFFLNFLKFRMKSNRIDYSLHYTYAELPTTNRRKKLTKSNGRIRACCYVVVANYNNYMSVNINYATTDGRCCVFSL